MPRFGAPFTHPMRTFLIGLSTLTILVACRRVELQPSGEEAGLLRGPASTASQDAFWAGLQSICGKSYRGRLVEGNASDSAFRTADLRMHVRQCAKQEFHADSLTAMLIPAARTNIWTVEIIPGDRFAYALRRDGTARRFRVEFDLKTVIQRRFEDQHPAT